MKANVFIVQVGESRTCPKCFDLSGTQSIVIYCDECACKDVRNGVVEVPMVFSS